MSMSLPTHAYSRRSASSANSAHYTWRFSNCRGYCCFALNEGNYVGIHPCYVHTGAMKERSDSCTYRDGSNMK